MTESVLEPKTRDYVNEAIDHLCVLNGDGSPASDAEIARRYGISPATITRIRKGHGNQVDRFVYDFMVKFAERRSQQVLSIPNLALIELHDPVGKPYVVNLSFLVDLQVDEDGMVHLLFACPNPLAKEEGEMAAHTATITDPEEAQWVLSILTPSINRRY